MDNHVSIGLVSPNVGSVGWHIWSTESTLSFLRLRKTKLRNSGFHLFQFLGRAKKIALKFTFERIAKPCTRTLERQNLSASSERKSGLIIKHLDCSSQSLWTAVASRRMQKMPDRKSRCVRAFTNAVTQPSPTLTLFYRSRLIACVSLVRC